jgi:hypothetical protein
MLNDFEESRSENERSHHVAALLGSSSTAGRGQALTGSRNSRDVLRIRIVNSAISESVATSLKMPWRDCLRSSQAGQIKF